MAYSGDGLSCGPEHCPAERTFYGRYHRSRASRPYGGVHGSSRMDSVRSGSLIWAEGPQDSPLGYPAAKIVVHMKAPCISALHQLK